MDALAIVGFGAFVLASLAVGTRLLLLYRRTHETPELAMGVALVSSGGISYGLAIAAFTLPGLPTMAAALLETLSAFFGHLGTAALALALRSVFRPEARWARALQMSVTLGVAGVFAARLVEPLAFPPPGFVYWPYASLGAAVYGWSVVESLHCHALIARRARIGLAEPDVARRFLLWALAGAAALGIILTTMVDRAVQPGVISPWTVPLTSALGLVAAAGLFLAFFPRRLQQAATT